MFPAEPVPETIGSYKILRRLPSAGAAEVYLAKAQGPMGFARECELKLMPDTSDGDASYAEELAREAAICARLNNPAVVRVFDFFEHHGKLVLALEHVEGHTLGELVAHLGEKHQKLGDQAIFYVGGRIAAALADAHAARDEQGNATPIIHRNLSPETVLISVDGDVRLTGFGVGKILGRTPDTAIGRIKGTPGYMAPEQARGEPVTTKADVYGLGLLLWSLLAGKRPPTDGTWPRRISGLRNDLPREVAAIVDAALDHFPGTRKITAREIEQWLSKAGPVAKGKGELRDVIAALRAETRDAESPPPSSRRRIAAVGSPYQGVRFGPGPAAKTSAPPHAAPSSAPPSPATTRMGAASSPRPPTSAPVGRARTQTVAGVGMTSVMPAHDPLPSSRDYALPPSAPRPAAPPPGNDSQTLPSRNLVPVDDGGSARRSAELRPQAPVDAPPASDEEPISIVPVSAAPTARPPARPAAPRTPAPSPATPPVLLAPVLPLAPPPAPPPAAATPAPSAVTFRAPPPATVAFGAPPTARTPAPATVAFGAPPAATTPAPATVAFGAPPGVTPAPSSVTFGAPPATMGGPERAPQTPPAATPAPAPVVAPALPVPDPPRRAPMPSLLTLGPGRRSLSAAGAVVVSALTATVVVSVALFFFVKRDKTPGSAATSSASAPSPPIAPTAATAAPSVRPSATASAEPSASDLPYGYGYLTVSSPANANVFVSGKLAGPVNKALKVRCGRWFIRLAAPQEGGHYPEWVSPGETAVVPCQESSRLDMSPKRP